MAMRSGSMSSDEARHILVDLGDTGLKPLPHSEIRAAFKLDLGEVMSGPNAAKVKGSS